MTISINSGNDPIYTAAFDDLVQEVFKFSFKPWLERNLWDQRYESHSIMEDGKMLANVCIFKTDMLVRGQPVRAHQFGAVATRASQRGKGLSRMLIEHVLDMYPNVPSFLGANDTVTEFYTRFGFRPVQTYRPVMDIAIDNIASEKCTIDDDIVQKALYGRRAYSSLVDSVNTETVQICQMLTNPKYKNHIYFLAKCGVVIVARQVGETLFLSDVICGDGSITFDDIAKELPFSGVIRVEFEFCPDWLGVTTKWEPLNEPYFICGDWNLPEYFRFPALSET